MEKSYDSPRAIRRAAPRQSATVAVFQGGQQLAYGVVTNLSTSGVCIVTDRALQSGADVDLKLSFFKEPDLYELTARVVWSTTGRSDETSLVDDVNLQGLQFTRLSALWKARLHQLLEGETFYSVYEPSATPFDALQSELSDELERLGSQIHRTTGGES